MVRIPSVLSTWRHSAAIFVSAVLTVVCCGACSSTGAVPPLQLVDAAFRLELLPGADIMVRKAEGGDATWDADPTMVLRNGGERSFLYLLESTVPWLGVEGATSGMLLPGHSASFRLTLVTGSPLPGGDHVGRLQVVNWVTLARELEVVVTLRAPPGPISQRGEANAVPIPESTTESRVARPAGT